MDPVYKAALQQPAPTVCTLIRMELKSGVVCLKDGGFAVYAGELYLGKQDGIGALESVGAMTEGGSGTTTRVSITINADSQQAVEDIASPLNQGGLVQWWEGAADPASGALVGQPLLKFQGQFDFGVWSVDESGWSIEVECGTEGELQLIPNTDWRANDATHRRIWGELGHANVSRLTDDDYWRTEAPKGAIQSGGGGSFYPGNPILSGISFLNQKH